MSRLFAYPLRRETPALHDDDMARVRHQHSPRFLLHVQGCINGMLDGPTGCSDRNVIGVLGITRSATRQADCRCKAREQKNCQEERSHCAAAAAQLSRSCQRNQEESQSNGSGIAGDSLGAQGGSRCLYFRVDGPRPYVSRQGGWTEADRRAGRKPGRSEGYNARIESARRRNLREDGGRPT